MVIIALLALWLVTVDTVPGTTVQEAGVTPGDAAVDNGRSVDRVINANRLSLEPE